LLRGLELSKRKNFTYVKYAVKGEKNEGEEKEKRGKGRRMPLLLR